MATGDQPTMGVIIFSLIDDAVWASWPSAGAVKLGPGDAVIYMMRDFLAQCDVAARLALRKASNG